MEFKDKRERFEWMKKHSPKMVEGIMKFKQAFGDIELSNVGLGEFPEPKQVKNLWK
jgi:hypothetical protein